MARHAGARAPKSKQIFNSLNFTGTNMTAEMSDPVIVQEVATTVAASITVEAVLPHPQVPTGLATNPQHKPSVHPEIHTVKVKMPQNSVT